MDFKSPVWLLSFTPSCCDQQNDHRLHTSTSRNSHSSEVFCQIQSSVCRHETTHKSNSNGVMTIQPMAAQEDLSQGQLEKCKSDRVSHKRSHNETGSTCRTRSRLPQPSFLFCSSINSQTSGYWEKSDDSTLALDKLNQEKRPTG